MKRFFITFLVILLFNYSGQSAKIITSFDIARWYLDSDLVIICTVDESDTILIEKHDTILSNQISESWNVIREKYRISVDSLIKPENKCIDIPAEILTPEFWTNYSKSQLIGKEFMGFDSKGDSIIQYTEQMLDLNRDFDYSYFRMELHQKQLVILRNSSFGYIIDYHAVCDKNILDLILEMKTKGYSYFPK